MSELNSNVLDPNAEKKYIDNTTFSQQGVDLDVNFADGTIKITDEINNECKIAVESRIESVKKYTKLRIARVDDNLKQYYSDTSVANDNKSLAQVFFPETFNAVEDWSDDLVLMFINMIDDLMVDDVGDTVQEFIGKSLELSESDDETNQRFLRSVVKEGFGKENIQDEHMFYFKKADIVKSFLQRGLLKSKFQDKLEEFLTMGIVSGMFVLKDDWGPTGEYKLFKSNGESKSKSSFKYELDQEDVYRFNPIDSRMLIFPKHGMPWVIEKINTTFHEILNITLDDKGEAKEGARYDINQLKKLAKELKNRGASTVKAKDESISVSDDEEDMDDTENTNLWNIDGDITVYESHSIPLLIKNDKSAKIYKFMISQVDMAQSEEEPDMITIGVQKTPYVAGIPYLYENFVQRDGDISGIGLPELIRSLQQMLNDFTGHSVDLLNLGLWGIMAIDADAFKDATKLKEITPRLLLKLKNMKGRNINEAVQWLHPRLDSIGVMGEMFSLFQRTLQRTTRKGPSSEKISPNPSATEFATIASEQQKSVNKVGIRLNNNIFVKMLERMYIYNIMNMKERVVLKVQSQRIEGIQNDELTAEEIETVGNDREFIVNDKRIELTPEELFIDGLDFKLNAADTFNKKSVEKQQTMQAMNLLFSNGAILNQDGSIHTMKDETGAEVFISEYRLYKKFMDIFGYEDAFEKVTEADEIQAEENNQEVEQVGSATQGPQIPGLDASLAPEDIAKQATTLSPGLEI